VTTTKAGMAVPDWPNTYGYNLFLYPWQSWLAGPWDLFVEHGHRLFAASVGLLTIGLVVVLMRSEKRRWLRGLGFTALGLVVFQGALGGIRVLFDERTLAMLHGMTGPLFFAVTVSMAVYTSRRWTSTTPQMNTSAVPICVVATATAVLVYLQIVLGAVLRHLPLDSQPAAFLVAVKFHLFLAGILTLHIGLLMCLVLSRARRIRPLAGLVWAIGALLLVQLALGVSTWLLKYSVPAWASDWVSHPSTPIQDGGWLQTHVITAHVATGSLILAVAVAIALFANRLLAGSPTALPVHRNNLEAAV